MVVLGGMINEYGRSIPSNETVNEYSLNLLYLAIGVGISAFVEGVCWTRTAERQTSRMRIEYLKSVLRQDVGYFDNQDAASTTFQVISTISSDAHLIQDTIAEKAFNPFSF
ncbi:putative multidrug resistance protein [Prunus yedoensis var. nudiflora]|uniref:Putative multidrug resistance protein n=1 Tax=Prunus yedoensis var. nudiflora TaxID=2094558 RepID=A0A314YJ57_PRUYE|nr:putative multidrug resistance protein [Prunus yedoensis var. nudiflora]